MVRPEPKPDPAPPEPKKRRSAFSFLFKSALGCTSFAVGAIVVFVLLLPTMASRTFAVSATEGAFNDLCQGSLKIQGVKLAWFGEQVIDDAVISDPDGLEVVRLSATLPSLVRLIDWESGRFEKIRFEVEGDLVADDRGVTNLQRAFALRAPTEPEERAGDAGRESSSMSDLLANLDVELALDVRRLTWSDAETRRIGAPFEVRNLAATLTAAPGAPLRVIGEGKLVSDPPGRLSIDATVRGPIVPDRAWPVGSVDAEVKIESFSSAMIDGLADLHGDLKDLLGPSFDIALSVKGATPTAGELAFVLDSQRTSLKVKGRFAENAFISVGEPALVASIGAPQAVLARRLAPLLPVGVRILPAAGEGDACTVRIENLVLPIPAGSLADRKQVRAALERLRCDVELDAPSIRAEGEAFHATGDALAVDAKLTASVAPGAPLVVALDGDLSGASKLAVRATVPEPWTLVSDGRLSPSDVDVKIDKLPVDWIQAFAPADVRLREALGDTIDAHLVAQGASQDTGTVKLEVRAPRVELDLAGRLEGGEFKSNADDGLRLHASALAGLVEPLVAAHLPPGQQLKVGGEPFDLRVSGLAIPIGAQSATPGDPLAAYAGRTALAVTCTLPVLRWSSDGGPAAALSGATITASLSETNALELTVRSTLDSGSKGELNLDVRAPDAWALARMQDLGELQPLDVELRVDRLPTALVDALAGTNGALATWLGPQISTGLHIEDANLTAGHLELRVETSKLNAGFAGKLEGGVFQATGDEGLRVRAQVSRADWERQVAPHLPPGTQFAGALFEKPIELSVRNIALAIPNFAASKTAPPAGEMLRGLSADASLTIPDFAWTNEALRAAKRELGLSNVALSAKLAPKAPLEARFGAEIAAASRGKLEVTFTQPDPWAATAGAPMPPFDARVALEDLPTDVIELFTGPQPMLTSLLGSPIDLVITADDVAKDRGALNAKLSTQSTSLTLAGKLQTGAFVCSGGDGLDLVVNVPAGYVESQLASMLPAGTRLSLPSDAGPLTAKIRNTKIALASSGEAGAVVARDASAPMKEQKEEAAAPNATLAFLADLGLKLEAGLPALAYSDAATEAAGRPIVLRETRMKVELVPGGAPTAALSSKIEDTEPGSIDLTVRALDPLSKLAQPGEMEKVRIAVNLTATSVPTAIVDVLARQDGLLVEALGQKLEVKAKTDALSLEQGTFVVDLTSPQASLHASGQMKDGAIAMSRTDRGVARFGLTPLASERVVGSLMPMMFNLTKPQGSDPVVLTLDDLSFPLGNDLSKLDATVNLNLGEVTYRLLPGIESMLGSLAGAKTVKVPNLVIPIRQGVATYKDMPISIGGQTCAFSGTFSLVDKTIHMSTAIPLSALGKKANAALEGARQYLDPNMPVPIEIRGSWKSPKVSIGEEFMKKVVENAAKGGLEDLLKGIGGKKKKD